MRSKKLLGSEHCLETSAKTLLPGSYLMAGWSSPSQPAVAAPLFSSFDLPLYNLSIGDGIFVYWDGYLKWYSGKIVAAAGEHECEVLYDDGEREWVALDKVQYIAKRISDSSSRRGRAGLKKGRSRGGTGGEEQEEVNWGDKKSRIKDIEKALLDIEDRVPLGGVYEQDTKWWQKWHDGVLLSVRNSDINKLMDSALGLSLQFKPNISSTWWVKHHIDWKKQLENVTTVRDAATVVKNLQDNAIHWPAARNLFSEDEAISRDEAKSLHRNESRCSRPSIYFGFSLDPRNQGSSSSIAPTLSAEVPLPDSIIELNNELGHSNTRCASATKGASFSNSFIRNEQCRWDTRNSACKRKRSPDTSQPKSSTGCGSVRSRKGVSSLQHKESRSIQNDKYRTDANYGLCKRKKNGSICKTKNPAACSPTWLRKGRTETFVCRMSSRLPNKSISGNVLSSQYPDGLLEESVPSMVSLTKEPSLKDSTSGSSSSDMFSLIHTCGRKPAITIDEICSLPSTCHESQNHPQIEENTKHSIHKGASTSEKATDQEGNSLDKSHDNNHVNSASLGNRLVCSFCQTAVAINFFVQCKGNGCKFAVHAFCFCPPLQTPETDWLCHYCKGECSKNAKFCMGRNLKKIQSIVGRRRIALEHNANAYQDQFLIKWDSLSHHRDSWVPSEWLHIFDRVRLQRFEKKYPFLGEANFIDQRKPEWFQIDRVIASRKLNSKRSSIFCSKSQSKEDMLEFEFLVKWKGLDYCDATWESSFSGELFAEVGKFIDRCLKAGKRSDGSTFASSDWTQGKAPDDLFKDKLYLYQLEGLNWILSNYRSRRNVILADEMGLGRTVQAVCFIQCIMQFNIKPVLVVAPKSVLFQWEKEFCRWTKDLDVIVYRGEKQSRHLIQKHEMYTSDKKVLFDTLITSYEVILLDSSILKRFKWSAIIIDEVHKIEKNDCTLASCLKQYSSDFRLLLTETLRNNLVELSALLRFIDPEKFSVPKAEAKSSANKSGLEHSHAGMKIDQIHEFLKPRMLRRTKSDVLAVRTPAK